jgi:hypothetical protein
MRSILFASAATLTLGLSAPALAQSAAWPYSHQPGTGQSGPASSQASNIDSADAHSTIAPHLPEPAGGQNQSPERYLRDAQRAVTAHHTGLAQQALEMAETRLLDRSTPVGTANQPDQSPEIQAVSQALQDLGHRDFHGTETAITKALAVAPPAGAAPM